MVPARPIRRRWQRGRAGQRTRPTSELRVIPPNRLRPSVAHLHIDLAPLRAGLHALRRIKPEHVLRPELVLDLVVDAAEVRRTVDVIHVPARLTAEAAELVADVDFRRADADADAVDRHGRAARVF